MSNARKISQIVVGTEVKFSAVDSDLSNTINSFKTRLDSDDAKIQSLDTALASVSASSGMSDSDLKVVADIRNQLDSEILFTRNLSLSYTNFLYNATAGQTSFTGNDANSATLAYTAGSIQVFLNGVLLTAEDFTATDGTTIVLTQPAQLSAQLIIVCPKLESNIIIPTYAVSRSTSSVNEGSSISFSLATTGLANGTNVPYTISGITTADISGTALTGNFVIGTTDAVTLNVAADSLTEGNETISFALDNGESTQTATVVDTSLSSPEMNYLIVGGGGGASSLESGGGGAGGMIAASSYSISVGTTYNITIGSGGAGNGSRSTAGSGTNSSIAGVGTAIGGGGGGANGTQSLSNGANGGSGGGGGGSSGGGGGTGGTGTSLQGNSGGAGAGDAGGGGGGAGAAGQSAPASAQSGNGGVGLSNSITGSAVFYAGGGGGGNRLSRGLGGNGGGGNGGADSNGTAGTPNTGGGGGAGGGSGNAGAAGGSGIVIIRIIGNTAASVTGASSTTTVGSDTVYVWNGSATSSGSITI